MNKYKFVKYIIKLGFESDCGSLTEFQMNNKYFIYAYSKNYTFLNSEKWHLNISYNDLRLIDEQFKKELRSIKLTKLLS